ncbi:PKD domain-containing protein [Desulfosarcina sp.]|nr:PKD domain-containing protein [Desulfosarcina sp.]
MKKITLFAFLMLILIGSTSAQLWTENLDQQKIDNGTLTLQDYQKAFNDYWEPYNVTDGYFYRNGEKIKAKGWKQFKRWEWKAQHLVDGEGNFPNTTTAEELEKYYQQYPDAEKSLTGNWTNIGYDQTNGGYDGIGRVNCIAFHPTNTNIFWVGSPSGGLWRTINGGTSWTVLTDNNTTLGVSAIAVTSNYATSNTLYIGTGDRDSGSVWSLGGGNTNDNEGTGVLKSTNGGLTWSSSLSFTPSQNYVVYDLLIDPNNNNILYAATDGGLYKTINGGSGWTQIVASVFNDLEFKPGNSSIIYAALKYTGWITKFTGSGSTWTNLQISTSAVRTELAVSAANSAVVYAVTVQSNGGLDGIYRSTNSGTGYSLIYNGSVANQNLLGYDCNAAWVTYYEGQGLYDVFITANPSNANDVYVGGINVWRMDFSATPYTKTLKSMWSGTCGATVNEVHADQHCCEFQNSSTIFIGNDGGIYKSTDAGLNWTDLSNTLTINQIYRIGQAPQTSNEIITGLQDNGTHLYSGGSWVMNGVIGGDGMECLVDPNNTNVQFAELQYGEIYRTSDHWSTKIDVRNNIRTSSSGSSGLAGDWVTPYMLDPNNSSNLFVGYDELWKSTDQGTTSTNFSKVTVSSYTGAAKMRSLEIAPLNSNYIYVSYAAYYISTTPPTYVPASLHRSTDGGSTWSNITGTLPVSNGEITYICVKNDDPNTVWVTLGGYNSTAVYQTTNGGTSWTNISTGLPQIPAMSIVQNIKNANQVELYVAMTQGVYVKYGVANWISFSSGLPNVFCTELEIYYDNSSPSNSKIRIGTYGRGLWESDIPGVDFMASNTLPSNSMTSVSFTDLSTNNPTAWSWSFNPPTVSFVGGTNPSSQNPVVQFNNPGAYSVTLTTTNALGNTLYTKTAYIHMGTPGLWTGNTSGAWNTITNWHNHQLPTSAIGVTVNSGASNWPIYSGNFNIGTQCGTLLINGNSEFTVTGDLTIPSGSQITCNANSTIKVGGDFNNFGTFTPGTSIVKITGNANSSLTGNISSNGTQSAGSVVPGSVYVLHGAYCDIVATGGKNITVNSFNIRCNTFGTLNVEIWYKSGTYTGFTSNSGVWTQLGTTKTVTGQGVWNSVNVNPGASLTIPSGLTYGFYINCYSGTTGYLVTLIGSNTYSNSEMTIHTGDGSYNISVGSGSWTGYTFLGAVNYSYLSTSNPLNFYDLEISKTNATAVTDGNLSINNDFIVNPGAWFTNETGNSINVAGNLLIEGSSSGKGSFIDNGTLSVTGSNTVEAYYTDSRWHFISSPVSTALTSIFNGLYLKEWNESSYTWSYVNSTSQPLSVGEGYEIWSTVGNPTINYTGGTLNTGNASPTVTATDSNGGGIGAGEGWNLVGNPYPSAIDWGTGNNPVTGYVRTNIDQSIYIWTGSQYATFNPNSFGGSGFGTNGGSQYIQSMQSFFVKANNTNPVLTIPKGARVHSSSANLKTKEDVQILHLKAEGNGDSDEILIEVNGLSSMEYDKDYDAYKLYGSDESPQMYVITPEHELSIHVLPLIETESEIPLGFKAGAINDYTITALSIENFDQYEGVLLEDLKTGLVTNLLQQSEYTFVSTPEDDPNRFILKFTDDIIGVEESDQNLVQIYGYDNRIYIMISDETPGYELMVYNMLGQKIGTLELINQSMNIFEVNEGIGFYIAEVKSDNVIKTTKILIK